jgi:hypothetical protein
MRLPNLFSHDGGAAAAEMVMVLPFLLVLLFGSAELGNYFLDDSGLLKQVRDGARYASRLPLAPITPARSTVDVGCPNVDRKRRQDRTGRRDRPGRFDAAYWDRSCSGGSADHGYDPLRS